MAVEIINHQSFLRVPKQKIKDVLEHVMQEELGREVNVNVAVTSNRKIAELNRAFLSHAGPTDVLAFPFTGEDVVEIEHEDDLFGEIIISAEMAKEEAKKRELDPQLELILYALHGMLHLVGYDDQTKNDAGKMRRRQAQILKSFSRHKG